MRFWGKILLSVWMACGPLVCEATNAKFRTPELPWIDAPPVWGDPNGKNGDGTGDANGDGTNGRGRGDGNGNEIAGNGKGKGGAGGGGGAGDGDNNKSQSSPGGGASQHLPYYYPMCLFIDEIHDQAKVNGEIKKMVDEAAQSCDVALIVFPFTVKGNYADNQSEINEPQRKMCNIPEAGIAPAASASTCVRGMEADETMCSKQVVENGKLVWKPATGGCAEKRAARGKTTPPPTDRAEYDAWLQRQEGHGGAKVGGPGGVAVSIEDKSNCVAGTIGHEALGHSQMGEPNGEGHGHGIGNEKGSGSGGWTAAGCQSMRNNAFDNNGRWTWNPKQTTYYVKPKDPSQFKDFKKPEPIFKSGGVVASGPPGGTPGPVGSDRLITTDGTPKTKPTDIKKLPQGGFAMQDGEGERHKRRPGDQLVDNGSDAPDEDEKLQGVKGRAAPPTPNGPVKPRTSLTYDESAPKRMSGSGGGGVAGAEPVPVDLYSGTSSGQSDAYAPGNTPPGSASAPPADIGSARASTITFDESAPKGAKGSGLSSGADRAPASSAGGLVQSIARDPNAGAGRPGGNDQDPSEEAVAEREDEARRDKRRERASGSFESRNPRSPSQRAPRGLSDGSRGLRDRKSRADSP